MSHEIVKSIAVKGDKVFLTSADSSLRPLYFKKWECTSFSKVLVDKGKEALYALIGKEVWDGNLELRSGSKLCNLYRKARNAFPSGLNFMSLDSKAAGDFLGKMVSSLEANPFADLSGYVKQALALQNDRDYILEATHRTGYNFLNCANQEIQNDREFALEVLRAGRGAAWFEYPEAYKDDKAFALEAVKLNGCFYRRLGDSVKADREIIREAFREAPDKKFHEHLPDIVPPLALLDFEKDPLRPGIDKTFIMELLDICPSMHMSRIPVLLNDRDIALKWTQVGKFFPYSVGDLPKQFLLDDAFQDVLCKRFEGTEKFDVLVKRLAGLGVELNKQSLEQQIQAAANRGAEARSADPAPVKGAIPQR